MTVPRAQATAMDPYLTGYEAPIHQALWKRILRWGAPRMFSAIWVAVCLYGILLCLFLRQPRWIIGVGACWAFVQGLAILVTQWDVQWDDVLLASLRYRTFYDAG
jgi:type IV secretory pathway TrbD component